MDEYDEIELPRVLLPGVDLQLWLLVVVVVTVVATVTAVVLP
jgi:hypothetical protein